MRIDRTHRGWALASLVILAISAMAYARYARNAPQGPRGGSAMGLLFGVVGFAFMLFASALGARKRVPTWRLGRAQVWMRAHLWVGALALPMIFFHGGFHFGGTLTALLMGLLLVTVLSGLFGTALQHYLPGRMTADVPLETIYDEIAHVRELLCEEADRAVEALCGSLGLGKSSGEETQRAGGFTASYSNLAALAASDWLTLGVRPGHSRDCAPCFPHRPRPPSRTWKAFARKRDSSCDRNDCIAGCTAGCSCTSRCPWPCSCSARFTPWGRCDTEMRCDRRLQRARPC